MNDNNRVKSVVFKVFWGVTLKLKGPNYSYPYLAEAILKHHCLYTESIHLGYLLCVKVFQLVHRQDTITVHIHTAEPVLNT